MSDTFHTLTRWDTNPEDALGIGIATRVVVPCMIVVDLLPKDGADPAAASDRGSELAADAVVLLNRALGVGGPVRVHLSEESPNTVLCNAMLADPRTLEVLAPSAETVRELAGACLDLTLRNAELEQAARDPREVLVRHVLTDSLCADVLCTALEGGIGYWGLADKIQTAGPGLTGVDPDAYGSAEISDAEAESAEEAAFTPFTLDYALIRRGFERILTGAVGARADIVEAVRTAAADNDAGQIDADAADVIVQVGAFNEITFG